MRTFMIIYLGASLFTQIVFIWGKLLGQITWNWYVVFLPLIIFVILFLVLLIISSMFIGEDVNEDYY